jgi:hypothetical protein
MEDQASTDQKRDRAGDSETAVDQTPCERDVPNLACNEGERDHGSASD